MSDNQPMGYVLPSGIKQLKNDHPATIYAPENPMVPGSHPVWLYDQPPAPAAVPDPAIDALEFYADKSRYSSSWEARHNHHVMEDKGEVARLALERITAAPAPAEPETVQALIPKGWEVEKEESLGVTAFIVRSPAVDGVQNGTAVFEDSEDPAEQLLYFILQSYGFGTK